MRSKRVANGMKLTFFAVLMVAVSGCATQTLNNRPGAGGIGPTLSVEQFLNAANVRDYSSMSRIFGTADGPIGDTGSSFGCAFKKFGSWLGMGDPCVSQPHVELRMDAIARLLTHEDYVIRSEERVAGRTDVTTQINVDMDLGSRNVSGVPFVVVKSNSGQWLVQEIGLSKITS